MRPAHHTLPLMAALPKPAPIRQAACSLDLFEPRLSGNKNRKGQERATISWKSICRCELLSSFSIVLRETFAASEEVYVNLCGRTPSERKNIRLSNTCQTRQKQSKLRGHRHCAPVCVAEQL